MGAHRPVGAGDSGGAAIAQHVLGKRQNHRARPSGDGDLEALVDQLGDALGDVDLGDPLGEGREHPAKIDLLEGLTVELISRDLPDEHDKRCRILEGGMDADRRVAGAGAARHEQHPGLAGELTIGLGHEGGAPFLAAGHKADIGRVDECIEHLKVALAGDTEGHLDAVDLECGNHELTAAENSLVRRHRAPSDPSCEKVI